MPKPTFFLAFFVLLTLLFSSFTVALSYADSYGYPSRYSSSPYSSYSSYRSPYSSTGRTTVSDEFLAYPYGSGSVYSNFNRNSLSGSDAASRSLASTTSARNSFTDAALLAQSTNTRSLVQDRFTVAQNQQAVTFGTDSSSYRFGDTSSPSYIRDVKVNFKGKDRDYRIIETIYGGQQVNLQRTTGYGSFYGQSQNLQRTALQDQQAAQVFGRVTSQDASFTQNQQAAQRAAYSLQQSAFGRGYTLVFN